jgi:hypothetical protein
VDNLRRQQAATGERDRVNFTNFVNFMNFAFWITVEFVSLRCRALYDC